MRLEWRDVVQDLMISIRDVAPKERIEGLLFCFGAPTIRGMKAACLLNFRHEENDGEDVRASWCAHATSWLGPFGVEWILLNEEASPRDALVMIYRRALLARALASGQAGAILAPLGYPLPDVDPCLEHLRGRFHGEFPHEIGLFLDYPPEDVRGFMERRKGASLEAGYWKVYGDVERARRTFARYRRAEMDAARALLDRRSYV